MGVKPHSPAALYPGKDSQWPQDRLPRGSQIQFWRYAQSAPLNVCYTNADYHYYHN